MKFLWEKFKSSMEWLLVSFPNKYQGFLLNVTLDKLNLDGNDWGENGKLKLNWTFPALNKELNKSSIIVEEVTE